MKIAKPNEQFGKSNGMSGAHTVRLDVCMTVMNRRTFLKKKKAFFIAEPCKTSQSCMSSHFIFHLFIAIESPGMKSV